MAIIMVGFLLLFAVTMIATVTTGKSEVTNRSADLIEAVRSKQSSIVENFFAGIEQDVRHLAQNALTVDALTSFQAAWTDMGSNRRQDLQDDYIANNPHPLGSKHLLDTAEQTDALYTDVHRDYHPTYRDFLVRNGYYDIFLLNNDGDIIYSVFKELDYAMRLWRLMISAPMRHPQMRPPALSGIRYLTRTVHALA